MMAWTADVYKDLNPHEINYISADLYGDGGLGGNW
jgi:hypothetical protein